MVYKTVDSFTTYETLEDQKTKAGGRKEFIYETRKAVLTIHYCTGDCQQWFTAEFPYLSLWQIYLRHTPQTAAQDLRVSSCTSEVFRQCKFKELTNNILQHSSCELSSLVLSERAKIPGFIGTGGELCMHDEVIRERGDKQRYLKRRWVTGSNLNRGRGDREKSGKTRRCVMSSHLNPPLTEVEKCVFQCTSFVYSCFYLCNVFLLLLCFSELL